MALLVVPESVWVEKRFAAGGTHQPHSQVHLPYMCTDGGTWCWWTLLAVLNPALIYSFDAPSWIWRGCILVGMASSEAGRTAGEADFIAWSTGWDTSGPVDSWGVDRKWWQKGCGGFSCYHRNPLPLNLPLLLPSFPITQSPSTAPPSPVCGPPPSGSHPFSVNPVPERWKKMQG